MQLPDELQQAVEAELESAGLKELSLAREDLTQRYRDRASKQQFMTTDLQRLSYLATRLPATYAAVCQALEAVKERTGDINITRLLDLGAGPGTALWAACSVFPSLQEALLLEKDSSLVQLGKKLACQSTQSAIHSAIWQQADLELISELPQHDLVILSYSVGELTHSGMMALIEKSWKAAQLLVIIEPGTPAGFERIRLIRRQLIELGGHLVAPCPHHAACPMTEKDWCHFAARVERSSFHRRLKGGTLPYEDEKFSYVAASKTTYPLPSARILRAPLHRSGHSVFTLCTEEGVKQATVSKRTPEEYKQARKLEWGDAYLF